MTTNRLMEQLDWVYANQSTYADIIELLRYPQTEILHLGDEALLLWVPKIRMISVVANSKPVDIEQIKQMQPELVTSHGIDDPLAFAMEIGLRHHMTCYQAAWLDHQVTTPTLPNISIHLASMAHLDVISDHYHDDQMRDYIASRIADQEIWIAESDSGVVLGFIGHHDEGSIGFLEVMPNARRRGIGRLLVLHLVALDLRAGKMPFAQIEKDNLVSLQMQRRLGFTISDQLLNWYL